MQWSPEKNAGFTRGTPWINLNPNFSEINVESQIHVEGSIYEFYRALIKLRHEEPVISLGDFELLAINHKSVFIFTRSYLNESIILLANFSVDAQEIQSIEGLFLENWIEAKLILGNYANVPSSVVQPLRPWDVRILKS